MDDAFDRFLDSNMMNLITTNSHLKNSSCIRESQMGLPWSFVFLLAIYLASGSVLGQENKISFSNDIKPILADNCFGCHQPARDRGSYIMTDFAKLREGGDSGDKAIVPGKPEESLLLEMIEHDQNGKAAMPPDTDPIAVEQVDLIHQWIAQGAVNDSKKPSPEFAPDRPPTYSRLPIISSIDFSPDGRLLAVTGFHEVLLLDASSLNHLNQQSRPDQSTPTLIRRLVGLSPRIESLSFSPDGKRLAVSGGSPGEMGEVQIWDVETGRLKLSKIVSYDTVSGVSWSPDGSKIAFGCTDTTVRAIDSKTGQQILFQGAHDDWIRDTVFSPDGNQLVTVGRDMSCKLIEVETQRFVDNITSITPGVLKGGINSVARHPSRAEVVIGGADGIPKVYRLNRLTKRVIGDDANLIRRMPQMPGRIQSVDVSAKANRIAAASSLDGAGHLHIYSYEFDATLPDEVKAIMAKVVSGRSAAEKQKVEEYVTRDVKQVSTANIDVGLYAVKFHPSGRIVAAAGGDGLIRCIDVETGQIVQEIQPIAIEESAVAATSNQSSYRFQSDVSQANPAPALKSSIEKMRVWPESIEFTDPTQYTQLVVQVELANGSTFDVTNHVRIQSKGTGELSIDGSLIQPISNGKAELSIAFENQKLQVPVSTSLDESWQPDFVQDVNPILTKVGCNAGTCHGSQDGKKGFKLSLRGYDPLYDIRALTDDMASRRTNVASPPDSLMLTKPTAAVAHEGGKLIATNSKYYKIIHDWIESGARLNLETAKVVSIEVFPKNPVLPQPEQTQQMRVVATYDDGSTRDVTREAVIETGDLEIAAIDGSVVTALRRGEAPLLARYEGAFTATTMTCMGDRTGFAWNQPEVWSKVDQLVANKWQRMKILPSDLCTDEEFIRRIYLDLTGLPPTAEATAEFAANPQSTQTKRDALIDSLIGNEAFVEHWSNKWADLLQVNRKYLGVEGASSFRNWIRDEVKTNTPYDQFVRKVLTASGSNRENPPAAYYKIHRTPEDVMENTTHLFLATRFNCNKCHDHPFERWTQDQYYETAAYFAQVQLKKDPESKDRRIGGTAVEGAKPLFEIVEDSETGEIQHDRTGATTAPEFPFSCDYPEPETVTRRAQLANWMTSADNPYFATSYVNRLWGYMLGVGLIEPLDDIRAGNPATNPQLLEYLEREFIQSGFDTRHMLRLICKSRVYQLSIKTNPYNADDQRNYSHALARRLPAEVLFDAIHAVTGSPLKIPGVPEGTRAAALPDAGAKLPSGFLSTLGRPARESACECERSSDLQLGSVLALVSGPDVAKAIGDPNNTIAELEKTNADDDELINAIFMQILNRPAEPAEVQIAQATFSEIQTDHQKLVAARNARQAIVDTRRPKLEKQREELIQATQKALNQTIQEINPDLIRLENEQRQQLQKAQAALAEYQSKSDGLLEWKTKQIQQIQWRVLRVSEFTSEAKTAFQNRDDRAILLTPKPETDLYTVTTPTKLTGITAFRLEVLNDASLPKMGPGLAENGNFVLNEIEVEIASVHHPDVWRTIKVASAIANFEQQGFPIGRTFDGNLDGRQGWAVSGALGKTSWATFQLELPVGYAGGSLLRFKLHQKFGGQHQIGAFRISVTNHDEPVGLSLSEELVGKLLQSEKTNELDSQQISEAFNKSDLKLAKLKSQLAAASQPVPVDGKIIGLREKLARVSQPVPEDPILAQLTADIRQSDLQLANERLTAAQDLAWALINSPSFLFNR